MPVYKFKTLMKARKALWNFQPDEEYFKAVAKLWETADLLSPIKYPLGIFKFKTLEDANKQRKEIEIAHARKVREERSHSPRL